MQYVLNTKPSYPFYGGLAFLLRKGGDNTRVNLNQGWILLTEL